MANGLFDQDIINAGLAGAAPPERRNPRPSLFDATAQNLFSDIGLGAGGRSGDLLGRLFGGFLPPSKKQKAALEQLKKERAQAQRRALVGATTELATAAGLSPAAAGAAGATDPRARAAIEATARGEPGGREALSAFAQDVVRQQLADTGERSKAKRAMLPIGVQQKVDEIDRAARAANIQSRRDLISDVEGNPALSRSVEAMGAAEKLLNVLDDPGFTALDLTEAAVLFTQVLEPGLAVREDDRAAFTRAATSGFETLKNTLNQFAMGEIQGQDAARNVKSSLASILRPIAQGAKSSLDFWTGVARDTPGTKVGDVAGAAGVTPQMQELIDQFALIPGTLTQ